MNPTEGSALSRDEYARGGYFPLAFIIEFLDLLAAREKIQVITYADLCWVDDDNHEAGYPKELAEWRRQRDATGPDLPVYVLLQHDVDSRPERTMELLRHEERLGIPSNVMIFNRRVNRRHLTATGELEYTEYDVDHNYLARLEEQGFVVGYHSNAFEQALWEVELAQQIFERDVTELRRRHRVEFFSPHGGARGPGGLINIDLGFPPALRDSMQWVHNGYTPSGFRTFSDGGINSPVRDPNKRDLREFVKTWKRGQRYRVLLHPQYYSDPCGPSPRMMEAPWYRELLDTYERGESGWSNVEIPDIDEP